MSYHVISYVTLMSHTSSFSLWTKKRYVTILTQRPVMVCVQNFNYSTSDSPLNNPVPTMPSESSIGMDNKTGHVLSNNNEVRGRNAASSNLSSREPSMVSSGRSTPYCDCMDMDLDETPAAGEANIESPELSYETE